MSPELLTPQIRPRELSNTHKARAVKAFMDGHSIANLAVFAGVHQKTIERTLREAFKGLVKLNSELLNATEPLPPGVEE